MSRYFGATVFVVATLFGSHALSQNQGGAPFGLKPEMSLSQLQKLGNLGSKGIYNYSIKRLPNGHPDIDDYRLIVTPKHGLCKITAWTDSIKSSSYGDELKGKFESFYEALTGKYGNSKRYDYLKPGSIWNEPNDFMMGLAKKERRLIVFWTKDEGSNLPPDIDAIALTAHSSNNSQGLISIEYELRNADDCLDWIKSQKDANL